MAYPNSTSWRMGMPTIIAKVSRSRRICTSSFSAIATKRASENEAALIARSPRSSCSLHVVLRVLHEADEHVLERRLDGCQGERIAVDCARERRGERRTVVPGHVQRRA